MMTLALPLSWMHFLIIVHALILDGHTVYVTDRLKQYRLEDFFWTGSGDSALTKDNFENDTTDDTNDWSEGPWRTTTIFHTTTIIYATVYPNTDSCTEGCTPQVSPVWTEFYEFSSAGFAPNVISVPPITTTPFQTQESVPTEVIIKPTTVLNVTTTVSSDLSSTPDQRYWLLTVLRLDNPSPLKTEYIEEKLASLYQKAFFRQRREEGLDRVRVKIHNTTQFRDGESQNHAFVYSVALAGEYVLARVAATDMQRLTQTEASAELGYPVLIKAEPYLKSVGSLGARVKGRSRDTWLLVGSIVAGISLLMGLAAIFAISLSKNRVRRSARGLSNKQQMFDREAGNVNDGFEDDTTQKAERTAHPKSSGVKFNDDNLSNNSSSCSSSEASLVRMRQQQKRRDGQKLPEGKTPLPRPRTRIRRVEDSTLLKSLDDADGALDESESNLGSPLTLNTPPSYLSMPSVKAFPRGARIPEPLNRVLEPVSIRDLDGDTPRSLDDKKKSYNFTRHGSLEDDPGVIGPVVWDQHCRNIREIHKDGLDMTRNSGRMRKRFTELLDDAFSLFAWSRSVSPEDESGLRRPLPDYRARSAVFNGTSTGGNEQKSRPKTTDTNRPKTSGLHQARGAWDTPSFFSRAVSTSSSLQVPENSGRFQPSVDPALILVDGQLSPADPAVPLIAAIKDELRKFRTDDNV